MNHASTVIGFLERNLTDRNIEECESIIKDFMTIISLNGLLNDNGRKVYNYINDVYYSEDDELAELTGDNHGL